jgi:predicted transcriptional regulator
MLVSLVHAKGDEMKFPSMVSDVMNEIISIDGDSRVAEAAKKMIDNEIGSIIVTEKRKPVGIITKSDMLARVIITNRDPTTYPTKKIMSSPLISINKDSSILDAMRFIRDQDIHQVLVNYNEKLVGIASEGDLISAVTLSSLTQFSTILRRSRY